MPKTSIKIKDLQIQFPIYLTDATRAVTKGSDACDLEAAKIEGVVVNTYHLTESPTLDTLQKFGGIKGFMNYKGLVTSDSGGWQVFSLIHRNGKGEANGKITDEGVTFHLGVKNKRLFTPEDSIKSQFAINSDIIVCLDDFTPPDASTEKIKESVDRTILWAKRSKIEFEAQVKTRKLNDETRPMLLAAIQGGWDREIRKYCAEKLIEIGFDGYGYGGYAINDETHKLDLDLSKFIADLIPNDKIKFALGVGKPHDIATLYQMGWQIFDCTLPTRDARHKRLYVFDHEPQSMQDLLDSSLYKYIYINRQVFKNDETPLSEFCDCHTCKHYSKAYLHHLFEINDTAAYRLASIHNLRHYSRLIELLRTFHA